MSEKPAKLKLSHRQGKAYLLLIICGALLIGGSYYLWSESRNNNTSGSGLTKKQIKDLAEEQEIAANNYSKPILSDNTIDTLNTMLQEEKFTEAEALAKRHLAKKNLSAADKEQLYGALNIACSQTKDLVCLEKVLAYLESIEHEEPYVSQYVVLARLALEQGNATKSRQYYAKAKAAVDSMGGKAYLEKSINQDTEEGIEYKELVDGAE